MHYAVSHGNFDVVSILLDSKVCNINQTNAAGYTCIMLVSLAQVRSDTHRQVIKRLFQLADVNIRAKQVCLSTVESPVVQGGSRKGDELYNSVIIKCKKFLAIVK